MVISLSKISSFICEVEYFLWCVFTTLFYIFFFFISFWEELRDEKLRDEKLWFSDDIIIKSFLSFLFFAKEQISNLAQRDATAAKVKHYSNHLHCIN